jgi:hypothetical protein
MGQADDRSECWLEDPFFGIVHRVAELTTAFGPALAINEQEGERARARVMLGRPSDGS